MKPWLIFFIILCCIEIGGSKQLKLVADWFPENRRTSNLPASVPRQCYLRSYVFARGYNAFLKPQCLSLNLNQLSSPGESRRAHKEDLNYESFNRQTRKSIDEAPVIDIVNGKIRGIVAKTASGKPYFSYRGIPYAMPPILEKRFAPPEPYTQTWEDVKNLTSYKSGCIGLDHEVFTMQEGLKHYNVTGEEDCLYLNVHVGAESSTDKQSKTVIFFIHGGGFSFGSPQQFEATYLMEKEVIYVNPAYRLGPLGFLSTGDEIVPGNNGLKDQVLALTWVKDNIKAFGGNPAKVQIVGVDAGGASVHFMFFTPLAANHFSSAFSFSGTIFSPWAFQKMETAVYRTTTLAKHLNCPVTSSPVIVQCFREKTAFDLVDNLRKMKVFLYNPFSLFAPVDDSSFKDAYFPEHPISLLKKGKVKSVPWMVSFTAQNYLYPMAEIFISNSLMIELEKKWHEYLPSLLFYNENCTDAAIALRAPFGIPFRKLDYVPFSGYVTDRNYLEPALTAGKLMASKMKNAAVYSYYFHYLRDNSTHYYISRSWSQSGVSNGDDVAYIFERPMLAIKPTGDEKRVSQFMIDLLLSFAETGQPLPKLKWRPMTDSLPHLYHMTGNGNNDTSIPRARGYPVSKFDWVIKDCSL